MEKHTTKIDGDLTMIDSKMRSLLSGLGGAYCRLCTCTTDHGCGREGLLEHCFTINRTPEETREDYNRLVHENGEVKKRKGDYVDRKGVTQEPVVDINLNSVAPL